MSDKITSDINGFAPGDLVFLFELDMSTGSAPDTSSIFRWHAGNNENMQELVWQGNKYAALPIEADGFEFSAKGSLPRPTLTVANITSLLSGVIDTYDDLIGAKVTRKRTFAKYLDSYCYTSGYPVGGLCSGESGACSISGHTTESACTTAGGVWDPSLSKSDCIDANKNGSLGAWTPYTSLTCIAAAGPGIWYEHPLADDNAHFSDEIWYIDRKAVETRTHIQFELTAAYDVHGVKLPSRVVVANSCPWVYKGTECGWSTAAVVTARDATAHVTLTPTTTGPASIEYTNTDTSTSVSGSVVVDNSGTSGTGAVATYSYNAVANSITIYVGTGGGVYTSGTGYTSAPSWTATSGGVLLGSGKLTLTPTSVASITLDTGGHSYGSIPTVVIGGSATATASLSSGVVDSLTLTSAGSSYTVAPTVAITGGGSVSTTVYVDKLDEYTTSSSADSCSKTFTACEMRFGYLTGDKGVLDNNELSFGGFPGAGIKMGIVN